MDIGGPVNAVDVKSNRLIYRYFLTITDDYSCYRWIYFMAAKSKVISVFLEWKTWVNTHYPDRLIRFIRSDNGREFTREHLASLERNTGIEAELTEPYDPQQNGVAERGMQTVWNIARALMK